MDQCWQCKMTQQLCKTSGHFVRKLNAIVLREPVVTLFSIKDILQHMSTQRSVKGATGALFINVKS